MPRRPMGGQNQRGRPGLPVLPDLAGTRQDGPAQDFQEART